MDNDIIVSLSFSSYSTNGLASIAVKITKEFNDAVADDRSFQSLDEEEDDFEFSLVLDDQGQIHHDDFLESKMEEKDDFSVKLPLKTLFGYDSSSSSETADELELPAIAETASYCCLWRPKHVESNKWKKSNNSSTSGERRRRKSRGWKKLFDLLRRSNSGGDQPFVFLNSDNQKMTVAPTSKFMGSPMEVFYVRSKAENEGSKRKSYLPYRQQLVGFFSATAKRNGY